MKRIVPPPGPRSGTLPRAEVMAGPQPQSGVRFEFDAVGCGPRRNLTAKEFSELLKWARVRYARAEA